MKNKYGFLLFAGAVVMGVWLLPSQQPTSSNGTSATEIVDISWRHKVTNPGMTGIWKDADGLDMSRKLGPDMPLALQSKLLACLVPGGTKVLITSGGFMSSDVIVEAGTHGGCQGVISNEHLYKKDKS